MTPNMRSLKASFVLLFFVLFFMPSNATNLSPHEYWKLKLGNISMPKVLKASLQLGSNEEEIVKVKPGYEAPRGTVRVHHYAHNPKWMPHDGQVIWFTTDQLLTSTTRLKLHFPQIDTKSKFLPLHVTKSIAISGNKLEPILNILSLNPKSSSAKYIKDMLKECNEKGIKGEVRFCAISLKDMIDFVTKLGKEKYIVSSTEMDQKEDSILMEFTLKKAQKIGKDDNNTFVCHKSSNPYAVFLCHNIKSTDVYRVSLIGDNGKKMNAIVVCHKDTSEWFPGHLAFQLLKLKPGGKPICHFLGGDAVIWNQI